MTSPKQLAANKANAKLSTGPASEAGKARSRLNPLKHGLTSRKIVIGGEDPREFDRLRAALMSDFNPRTSIERELLNHLAGLLWRLRRVPVLEAALMQARLNSQSELDLTCLSDTELNKLHKLVNKAMGGDQHNITKNSREGSALTEDGGIEAFGKLSRYEASLLNAATRTLTLLHSLRNSNLLNSD